MTDYDTNSQTTKKTAARVEGRVRFLNLRQIMLCHIPTPVNKQPAKDTSIFPICQNNINKAGQLALPGRVFF